MKQFLVLLALILTLTGCSVKAPVECVTDTWEEPQLPCHVIDVPLPSDLTLSRSHSDGRWALFENDRYQVEEEIFSAATADEAFVRLTGKTQAQLMPLTVPDYPFTGYRFAWAAAGEEEPVLCSGALLFDGHHYYSVIIRCPPEEVLACREVFAEILSQVRLGRIPV